MWQDVGNRRRRRVQWVKEGGLVVVVLAVIATPVYRVAYGEWPWTTYPAKLTACGIEFVPQGDQTREQLTAQGYRIHRIGTSPGWFNTTPLWTTGAAGEPAVDSLHGGCDGLVWLQGGSDTYRLYAESGGPTD